MVYPLEKMWSRIEVTRSDSETSLFYDLMILGEMMTKLVVVGLISLVQEDRERQRYALEHSLVRANGVGDWVKALDELTSGPASALLAGGAVEEKRQLMQRWSEGDNAWQREAVELLHDVRSCLEDKVEPLPQKVSLLRWFQDFAWLRNRTKAHGATTGTKAANMTPLLEASLKLISENFVAFEMVWIFLKRNNTGKYRISTLAGKSDAFNFLKTEDNHQFPEGLYRGLDLELYPAPLIFSDVDLSDFYFANGNYRDGRFETLSYVSDRTLIRESPQYHLPPSALPLSGTTAGPTLDVVGKTFVNLPPRSPDYVARPELERSVSELLCDDRHPIITLVGRGGVGKTSAALEVLYQVAGLDHFFAILWFSARDIDLLTSGPKRVQPDVLTEKEIAKQFVTLMNPAGSASRDFDDLAFLQRSLQVVETGYPLLFVFDNFETVRNPNDVFNTIDTYIRLPNKALITSRMRSFRGDYPVEVRGMTRDEFESLVAATASRLCIEQMLTTKFMNELFEESDGHPYVVKVMLGELAIGQSRVSLERVLAGRDDILDALFERTYSSLPPVAQRVFLTLSNWRSIVPRLAVEAALLRPSNDRMDVASALDLLEKSSLIEVLEGPSSTEEFVRVPLAACIFGQRKLVVSSMRTAIESDTEIIRLFGAAKSHEAGRGLGPRVDRMVSSLKSELSQGQVIDDGMAALEFVAKQYPPAWLKLADLIEERGGQSVHDITAVEAIKRYLEASTDDRLGWDKLAGACARNNDSLGEVSALLQMAQLNGATLADISRVANRFNSLVASHSLALAGDDKRVMAARIRQLLEEHIDEADATTLSRMAWLCLHLEDEAAARMYVERGLGLEPTNTYCLRLIEKLS